MKIGKFEPYKEYTGSIEYSGDDKCYFGYILDIDDVFAYEANTVEELETEFHKTVNEYIEIISKRCVYDDRCYSENQRKIKEIQVKYFSDKIETIVKIKNGDWIDLRSAETVELKTGEYKLIPLGVGMILPKGYEAHVVPRSSTYKNFGVIQTNHQAVIDESYCGDNDQWFYPVYALRDTVIHVNDRICQFRIMKKQPEIEFKKVEHHKDKDRGGVGSTGKN